MIRFKKQRTCDICWHKINITIACGLGADLCDNSEERKDISLKDNLHYHCKDMCLCTYGGCMPMKEEE